MNRSEKMVSLEREPVCAILVLATPPTPYRLEDWYMKEITGVPFLLLNILNIQRGGVNQLTLFHGGINGISQDCIARIESDPRVTAQLVWENNPEKLREQAMDNACRLVLNGGALHDKWDIRSALDVDGASETARPITEAHLDALIQGENGPEAYKSESEMTGAGLGPRFLSGTEETQVRRARDFKGQNERLLKTCGLNNDSLLDRTITRLISRQLTRLFLMTSMTPNRITLVSLLIGLSSSWFFLQGTHEMGIVGASLLLFSAWVDCVDGEVARLRFQESPLGGIFDVVADNLVHIAVFFSMGWGLYFATEQGIYKVFGSLAVLGTLVSFLLMQSDIVESKTRAAEGQSVKSDSGMVDQIANRDFTYFVLILAIIDQLALFIALTAVGSNIFAAYLWYARGRPGRINHPESSHP